MTVTKIAIVKANLNPEIFLASSRMCRSYPVRILRCLTELYEEKQVGDRSIVNRHPESEETNSRAY
jgi:hypothetical protein